VRQDRFTGGFFVKYAILMSLVGVFALVAGCGGETPSNTGGSGGSESSSSSASSSGMGGAGGGSSSSSGSTSTSSSSSTSTSTSSSSSGSPAVCDNPAVVDNADGNVRCVNGNVVDTIMAPVTMVWADSIPAMNGFSSQYSPTDYGAIQATGAPDVYPNSGDEAKAWASQSTDDMAEFIIVEYKTPVVADSVWVFQTFNPGAISKITVKAMDADHVVYENMNPQSVGSCAHVLSVSTKTCSPITSVRIDVASPKVSGYNEIDAVGLLPHP
jgi:hypothetical protein